MVVTEEEEESVIIIVRVLRVKAEMAEAAETVE